MLTKGDRINHPKFGLGEVIANCELTAIVRFGHGIEECLFEGLDRIDSLREALARKEFHAPIGVVTRAMGEAIRSVNDAWGVFARSKIALLPHQLWVCCQVNRDHPTRWLVADDVGLGKTIEAGLILMPLIARGNIKRLLILCPASLVEQWQFRMRTMFDIRLSVYSSQGDTPKADYWNSATHVVASLHTVRSDSNGRHDRMVDAEPWDMVIVDEAHHLNADEDRGPTLGYKLVDKLQQAGRIHSMIFFTGTPHRGKNYGFLSLLHLLRPDLFKTRISLESQLHNLKFAMIRNNKQSVTDLAGNKLFKEPIVRSETYTYNLVESDFYDTLTDFILTGKTYACSLGDSEGRVVMFVLIAMQKLASSSVAAIRRALHGRLNRIMAGRKKLEYLEKQLLLIQEITASGGDTEDGVGELEEAIAEQSAQIVLMLDEEPRLRELVAKADLVEIETKITKIIGLLGSKGPFEGRSVLFFTEYKATQSLLMAELYRHFGPKCTAFINGDGRADGVPEGTGQAKSLSMCRERSTELFNSGEVRFLVSTEAGGEGIDLQERCHCLIHVDLPWNPMRLHQRVGRLNRYGQQNQVEVFTLRNPDTVESRIWDKLNTKIERIMRSLQQVMAEPEDLLQLILGMATPGMFTALFAESAGEKPESVGNWFDTKTAHFGGRDAVETVRNLVGHCARFDFQKIAPQIPRLDLPDLEPFFRLMLVQNSRQIRKDSDGISFKTPELWVDFPGARKEYSGMIFNRNGLESQKILGIGHRIFDNALKQATSEAELSAILPIEILQTPLFVFRINDRITGQAGNIRSLVVAVEVKEGDRKLLRDWELILRLNAMAQGRDLRRTPTAPITNLETLRSKVEDATKWLSECLPQMDHPFRVPEIGLCCLFIPSAS